MGTNEIIVGLDIGTTKIAVIVGHENEYGKVEILGYGKTESLGVRRGMVSNIERTVQSIKVAVEEASAKSGVEINSVTVGIAGQHIKSLQHKGSIMRNSLDDEITQADIDLLVKNMQKLVMPPGEEIIHVIPQEFIVDKETGIKDPIGMVGIELGANFHIITGQMTAEKNITRCVTKAGLGIEDLILEPIAAAESVLSEEEKEAGVALVDIGGGTSDIAIFQEGIIRHTAVIPFGGDIVTEDIKTGCLIIKKQAEALKIRFGSAFASENNSDDIVTIPGLQGRPHKEISIKNLANIIQARMEEIIEHIYYEIKSSGFEKKLIAGIVLTGGGSQLKHLIQLTSFITGMETRLGLPVEHLASKVPEEMTSPMYATSIGLVIKGIDNVKKMKANDKKSSKGKADKTRGSFFESIFKKGKEFFEDDNIE